MQQKVTIELENMKFYAYHGHYEIEQTVGNHFLVNLSVETDAFAATQSDRLKDAIDYQRLYVVVKEEMEIPSHLLEHVANRIASRIETDFETITKIKVKISKINPPMGGEMQQVSVTLER
jgi:7,8-dihydroneopterin aldolase/epimerase/oxygenase